MLVRIGSDPLEAKRRASGSRSSRGGSVARSPRRARREGRPRAHGRSSTSRRAAARDGAARRSRRRGRVDRRDACARPVEPEQGEPVLRGEQPVDGLDVLGARRLGLDGSSPRGSRTRSLSRTGFGSTPAKSNTQARWVTALRIVSRLYPPACSRATASAISCGVNASTRRAASSTPDDQIERRADVHARRLGDVDSRCAVGGGRIGKRWRLGGFAARAPTAPGTRIAASSPSSQRRRSSASARVRKLPAYRWLLSRPPSR